MRLKQVIPSESAHKPQAIQEPESEPVQAQEQDFQIWAEHLENMTLALANRLNALEAQSEQWETKFLFSSCPNELQKKINHWEKKGFMLSQPVEAVVSHDDFFQTSFFSLTMVRKKAVKNV